MKESKISIQNKLSELERIVSKIDEVSEMWNLPPKLSFNLNLVLEELLTNTISYGYADDTNHAIDVSFFLDKNELTLVLEDDGIAFNPIEKESPPDLDKGIEEKQIGGLGIFFVKNLMDDLSYVRKENRNILTLKKDISSL